MTPSLDDALEIREAISEAGIDIYDRLASHPELLYSIEELAALLRCHFVGLDLSGPPRSRSKIAKAAVCEALGYPTPSSFRRVRPRFPGQDLDVYVQQSDNLQIWNEELSPTRRYALVRVSAGKVVAVRVVEGTDLEKLDRTGTLTSKYQARRREDEAGSRLVSRADTESFIRVLDPVDELPADLLAGLSPVAPPVYGRVLSIGGLYRRLVSLVGVEMENPSSDRQRGQLLHERACAALGLGNYADSGRFPDIACQALEVKLQTTPTIDLGLVTPASGAPAVTLSPELRHCDSRYLIAYATAQGATLCIESLVLTTGNDFFDEFRQFEGLVQNRKIQLPLPRDFFDSE